MSWSRKKRDDAPRGVFVYPRTGPVKVWGIRFRCGRGCRHEEQVGGKSAAINAHAERRAKIRHDRSWCPTIERVAVTPVAPPLTFAQHAETWHATTITPQLKERTVAYYRQVLDHHLLPVFGSTPLAAITTSAVRELMAEKAKTLGRQTIKNIVATLRACLEQAVADGMLPRNPAARLGRHARRRYDRRAKVRALEPDQVGLMLALAEKLRPAQALAVETFFLTGLRTGELFALQESDLDTRRDLIHVGRSVAARKGVVKVDTTKTHKARTIDVPPALMTRLRAAARQAKGLWIFPSVGDPQRPTNDSWFRNRVWKPIRVAAELPASITVHTSRHSYASILLRRNVPIAYVSRQLGHSSIAVTVDLYGHFVPHADRHHVVALAEVIEAARLEHEAAGPVMVPLGRIPSTS